MVNPKKVNKKEYYSTIELAQKLGISRVAVFKKIKNRRIEAYKCGRNYIIPVKYKVYAYKKTWIMSKPEIKVRNILDELYPNIFKFVGNRTIKIDGFIPDFIRVDQKKQVIEVFGIWWHQHKTENDAKRISTYKSYGFEVLVIWDYELDNLEKVKEKIIDFARLT